MLRLRVVYSARSEFTFFAKSLYNLQKYVTARSPNDWKAVWGGCRDVARSWALGAVVIYDGAAMFLGTVQVGLAAAQVASGFERSASRF